MCRRKSVATNAGNKNIGTPANFALFLCCHGLPHHVPRVPEIISNNAYRMKSRGYILKIYYENIGIHLSVSVHTQN